MPNITQFDGPSQSELIICPAATPLADNLANPTTTQIGANNLIWNGTTWERWAGPPSGDSDTTNSYATTVPMALNGLGWDRPRNNVSSTLLASAAAGGATRTSADQTNFNGRGVRISIDVSAYTSGSLVVTIQSKDSVSGVYSTVLSSAAIVATGHTELRVYPGLAVAANLTASDLMSRTWRVTCAAVTATYSVAAETLL